MNDFEGMPTIGRSPSERAEGGFVEIMSQEMLCNDSRSVVL